MKRIQIPPAEIAASAMQNRGVESILEVGCGEGGILSQFRNIPQRLGVDIDEDSLVSAKFLHPHLEFRNVDITVLDTVFATKSYDAVIASDVLEHFEKEVSDDVLRQMERVAKRFVIVWGPLGMNGMEDFNKTYKGDKSRMRHMCVLTEEEFAERGFMTVVFPSYWSRYYRDEWTADGLLAIKELGEE